MDTRVAETRSSNGEAPPARRPVRRQASGPVDTAGATRAVNVSSGDSQPAATEQASLPPSSGGFSVQVGAFSSRAQADKVQQDLSGKGYEARVVPGPRNLYRVRVGVYADRDGAGSALAALKQSGMDGMVVEAEPR